MRNVAMLSMVVVVTLGSPPLAKTAVEPVAGAATLESVSGEVVAVFPEARQLIITEAGWFTPKEVSFVVAEEAAPMLAALQIGDRVEVSYVETQGHPLARKVRKIPAAPGVGILTNQAPRRASLPRATSQGYVMLFGKTRTRGWVRQATNGDIALSQNRKSALRLDCSRQNKDMQNGMQ